MESQYKIIQGEITAPTDAKIAIVVSRFNELISSKLLGGAIDAFTRLNFNMKNLSVVWVPGAFEISVAAKKLIQTKNCDAILCLGAVIRGSTPHFDYIAAETAKAIAHLGLDSGLPIIYGVITADNLEQALERAGTKMGNKGYDGALTLIEMLNLLKKIV